MHDAGAGQVARRKLKTADPVSYSDSDPSAFASMLGGLIDANIANNPARRKDFDELKARVGVWVTDIDEGVTLEFQGGTLVVANGLRANRDITIRTDTETVMNLSNLRIGLFGMPVYYDDVGRGVAAKLLQGKLRIDGLLGNIATVNTVTRIFSVR